MSAPSQTQAASIPDAIRRVEVTGIPGQGTRALVKLLRADLALYAKQSIGSLKMFSHRTAVGSGKFFAYLLGIPFGILHRLGYVLLACTVIACVVSAISGNEEWKKAATGFFALGIILYILVRYAVEPVFRFSVECAKSVIGRRADYNRFYLNCALERGIRYARNERELFHGYLGLADTALDVMEPGDQNSHLREDLWLLMGAFAESKLMDTTARKNLPVALPPDRKPLITLIRWVCIGCGLINEKERDTASAFLQGNPVTLSATTSGQSQWAVFSGRYGSPGSSREHRVRVPSRTALDAVTSMIFGVESSLHLVKADYAPLESRLFGSGYSSMVNQIIEYRVRSHEDGDRVELEELRRQIFETTSIALGLPEEEDKEMDRIQSISGVEDPLLAKMSLAFRESDPSAGQRQG